MSNLIASTFYKFLIDKGPNMRNYCVFVTFVIAVLIFIQPAFSQDVFERDYPNMLYNPSFEIPGYLDQEQAQFWQDRNYTIRTDEQAHEGNYSLKGIGPISNAYTFQHISLRPNMGYDISAWVRTQGLEEGQGVGLRLSVGNNYSTSWSGSSSTWTQISGSFTTDDNPSGRLDVKFDIPEDAFAWVDDIVLKQTDGDPNFAPAPIISPNGGIHDGAVQVTLSTTVPNAQIRYTIDGSDPHPYSTLYYGRPFRLAGSATVKARVFHTGYKDSPVASADFTLNPVTNQGVPFSPIGWGMDVEDWWANHIHNPESSNYWDGEVVSPTPIINVADVRDANPGTTTAGIIEALAQLPASGGTLYFPADRGPYIVTKPTETVQNYYPLESSILILRRSNIHFIGDDPAGSVIQCAASLLGISSMEHADYGNFSEPVSNFYFKNLTFDGLGQAELAMYLQHSTEVLYDNCRFVNFGPYTSGHPGYIHSNLMSDNFWVRDCYFDGAGDNGIFYDGMRNAGVLNCQFNEEHMLFFTNNDMAPFSAGQRTVQYMAIVGNSWNSIDGETAISMTASNILIKNNTLSGDWNIFVSNLGRGLSNIVPYLWYNGSGIKLVDNQIEHVNTVLELGNNARQHTWQNDFEMKSEIRGNSINSANSLAILNSQRLAPRDQYEVQNVIISDNQVLSDLNNILYIPSTEVGGLRTVEVYDNYLAGTSLPRIVTGSANLSGIYLGNNDLFGTSLPLLQDNSSTGVPAGAVTFVNNRMNPTSAGKPAFRPGEGGFVGSADIKITCPWPNADIYYTTDGLTPTTASTLYTGPISLNSTTTLKAFAVASGYTDSIIADATFTLVGNPDTIPPTPPAGLNVNANSTSELMLDWQASSDNEIVQGYHVYRDGFLAGVIHEESFRDWLRAPGTDHRYEVFAFDGDMNLSATSGSLQGQTFQSPDLNQDTLVNLSDAVYFWIHWLESGWGIIGDLNADQQVAYEDFALFAALWTGPDIEAPTVPKNLTEINASDINLSFRWDPSNDNVSVTHYNIYRDGSPTSTGSSTTNEYQDVGLTPETSYTYRVSAADNAGNESALSDPITITTLADVPQGNLFSNPSFETAGVYDWPDEWQSRLGYGEHDTTVARTGSASFRVTGGADGASKYTFANPMPDLIGGHDYRLAVWVKVPTTTDQGLRVGMYSYTPNQNFETGWTNSAADWTEISIEYTLPVNYENGALRMYWNLNAGEEAWFDDISLEITD